MRTVLHSRGSIQWLRWKGHDPKGSASDRMALPLPFPPTELQVIMSELANGICESKNLILLGGGCNRARWARRVAAGVWDISLVVLQ